MAPVVKLQLSLHASNLPRTGKLRHTPDTFAQVALVPPQFAQGEQPVHLGSTDTIKRNSNPRWSKIFLLEYEFGTTLNFAVDVLSGSGENAEPRSIGLANFEVGDILGSRNKTKVKRLRRGGCVFAHIEQGATEGSEGRLVFQLCALRLDYKSGALSRAEPSTYFEISRQTKTPSGNKWVVVYRSQPVLESLRPCWDKAEVDIVSFCNGDLDRPILVSVYVHKKRGNDLLLGSFETTVKMLIEKAERSSERDWHQSTFTLQKPGYKVYESVGTIAIMDGSIVLDGEMDYEGLSISDDTIDANCVVVTGVEQHSPGDRSAGGTLNMEALQNVVPFAPAVSLPRYTFSDFVEGGLELDFCIAIDFTSSNGDPRIPGNLHYNSDGSLNDYEETILSVGSAIAKYSSEQEFPVWGFGAKYGGQVRHIFQCGPQATAKGVDGILDDYRSVFQTDLTMSGPTVILSVIKAAAVRAKKFHQQADLRYGILLILSDGIVSDIDATKNLLESISELPLSVLIIGIGMADFREMHDLVHASNSTSRPNANFVAYRPHQHDPQSLSREALKNVPDQIVEYFEKNGIEPRPGHRQSLSTSLTINSAISELSIDSS